MRVLFLSPCAQRGGAERALLDLLASIRAVQPRWPLTVLAAEHGPMIADCKQLGVNVEVLPFPAALARTGLASIAGLPIVAPAVAAYRRALHTAIRGLQPDLIHSNGVKMHLLSAGASPVPVIWHLHDYPSRSRLLGLALSLASHHAAAAIAVSEDVARDARGALRAGLPVYTVLNAVDLARFRPAGPKADLDQLCGFEPARAGATRVGLAATFAHWKGHEVFLRALASEELRDVDVRGYVIGGPIYRTSHSQRSREGLERLASDLGIADRAGFTGFLPRPEDALRALDVVVHASTAPEPFGLAIAEAMAAGRALVAIPIGGAAELFRHNENALAAAPGDPRSLAAAIRRLALDPVLRGVLGVAARETAETRFDHMRLGCTIPAIYRQTIRPCDYSTSTAAISTAA